MSRVLIGCEFSGVVRDAFTARGHEAWSCDLQPTESFQKVVYAGDLPVCECCLEEAYCPVHGMHYADCVCLGPTEDDAIYTDDGEHGARHIQGNVLDILGDGWDLGIFHPPCTYITVSGLHWNSKVLGREEKTEEALTFVRSLLTAPIDKICLENPVGLISTFVRPWSQYIQPYEFGEDASKKTGLWLKNLPALVPTKWVRPRLLKYKGRIVERWSNQTDSGQNILGPSETRSDERSRTYPGIAEAMAEQWGRLI